MKIMVLSSFTTSLFWFRIDMMKSFQNAGCQVVAVGNAPEQEWAGQFQALNIRYHQIPVQRNGTNPLYDLKTLRALYNLLKEEKNLLNLEIFFRAVALYDFHGSVSAFCLNNF